MNGNDFEPIEGGCLCGAVRYRITKPPLRASFCHCRICQRAGGAPVVSWVITPADGFGIVAGEPAAFRSSPEGTRQFCGSCGTQLTFRHTASPGEIDVTGASLDDPDAYAPQYSIWSASRRAYMAAPDAGMPVFEGDREM